MQETKLDMELKALMDARDILGKAYLHTIGMDAPHQRVWHAIEHIDKQTAPILEALMADPEAEVAA